MDLVDLFVGSEGTLGVITEATLRIAPTRPTQGLAFITFADRAAALRLVARLREEPIVSAIEHMDARCLELLREDGADRRGGVTIPADAQIALLATLELPRDVTGEEAIDEMARLFDAAASFDCIDVARPADRRRAAQLLAVREAVPAAVNARVGRAQLDIDSRISKTAADMIVPFDRLGELMSLYDEEFHRRGLDAAVWGHISDGNLHPNVLPRSFADVESGKEAILGFGRNVIRMGGSPLAEHGVGRNPIKQRLLREMYGDNGIDEMRAVKRALDPEWKLAPGVLFTRER